VAHPASRPAEPFAAGLRAATTARGRAPMQSATRREPRNRIAETLRRGSAKRGDAAGELEGGGRLQSPRAGCVRRRSSARIACDQPAAMRGTGRLKRGVVVQAFRLTAGCWRREAEHEASPTSRAESRGHRDVAASAVPDAEDAGFPSVIPRSCGPAAASASSTVMSYVHASGMKKPSFAEAIRHRWRAR